MVILFDELHEFSNQHPLVKFYFQLLMVIVAFSFPVISLVLFPFYVRVNRKNRTRDEKLAIYPLTNYFFKATCFTESCFLIGIILTPLFLLASNIELFKTIFLVFWFVFGVSKLTVTLSVNILISTLSMFRFLLYFFPKFANLVTPSKRFANWLLLGLHIPLVIVICMALYAPESSEEDKNNRDETMQVLQFSLNLLVILCTFPYFLMMMSIRKLSQLSSNITSEPGKYMKCQIMILLFSKLLLIPFLFTMEKGETTLANTLGAPVFVLQLVCETIMTPLMIEAAYLLSNKTNFDALRNSKCSFQFFRKPFRWMNPTKVSPEPASSVPVVTQ